MEDIKSKVYLSWDDIEWLINYLAQQIIESGEQIDSIYGLPRGGLVPAVMLSHKLNIPMTNKPISPNTLIVDDICDSGETFFTVWKKYHEDKLNLKFTCLHFKPDVSIFEPNFYGNEVREDIWIVYPWESKDADAIQDYLK